MQPQYYPQQPPQYGMPRPNGPGVGPPGPGNHPPDNRPSPSGTPGNYQQQGPPRGYSNMVNGAPDHLANQMSGMNIGQSHHPAAGPGFPAKVGDPAVNFPLAVNGSVNGSSTGSYPPGPVGPPKQDRFSTQQQGPLRPDQFPSQGPPQLGQGPPHMPQQGQGPQQGPPQQMPPQGPPQLGQGPPHMPQQRPPQQMPLQGPSQLGQGPQQGQGLQQGPPQQMPPQSPAQPGQGPQQGPPQQMLPQGPPHQGQGPPQSHQFLSHSAHVPPVGPPQQMPLQGPPHMPQQGHGPPKSNQFPPHSNQMPPQPGQMPPQPGHLPPQPGQMPPHLGHLPPQPGQMPPQPGQMPLNQSTTSGSLQQVHLPPLQGQKQPPPGPGSAQIGPQSVGARPPSSGPPQQSRGFPQPVQNQAGFPPNNSSSSFPPQPSKPSGFPAQPGFGGPQTQSGAPNYPPGPAGFPPQQQQPMGGQYPPSQPMAAQYPPSQPMAAQYPPTQPMGGQYPSQPMGGQYPSSQPQQARRLDPDQMPSPIQVMQDDQRNRAGVFVTNQKGLVPPIVTTDFTTQDQGNCSPRYMRSTMYNVPATQDMMKQAGVPFSLVISPLARPHEGEYGPPIVDMGPVGPVRCVRCKAYMCPFMQFVDGGRRFHCLFCKATSDVPAEYFQHLDHTGQRVDRYERPELVLGCYEFVATKDYCRNNVFPKPPAYIFLLDVSYNNVKSGLVSLLCSRMKEVLRCLPQDTGTDRSTMRVGFITYNSSVHFYNVKGSLAQAQMLVVGDVSDMFMPLLDGFLVSPEEAEQTVDSLMAEIPTMFQETRDTETLLAPAIQAGLEALKAAECVGKLLVFHSSLPIAEAPGKLRNRDDRKLLGTDKEKTVLSPQNKVYNELAQDCAANGCAVDLFLFNNSYIDIATIGQVARLTGGEIFKYTYFQADIDGERLVSDVKHDVSRAVAFDAIMRVRTSTGVRPTDFYGHFFMQNTTDMELAAIDCDKAVALEIKHDDALTEEDGVYIQVALLYTSCGGQRRLRVLNLGLKTCTQMADLYRSCDLDTLVNFYSKQAVSRLLAESPKPVKDSLVARCAQILASYRKNCASPSSAGQLILPECMKLLPLYVNCLLKSDAIAGGSEMTLDDRSFAMSSVTTMAVSDSVCYFYPRLLPLMDMDDEGSDTPQQVRCSSDKLREDGAYILENGLHMFLWLGLSADPGWVSAVFGVASAAQVDTDRTQLPDLDNPTSLRVRELLERIREERHRYMRLTLVRQRDKMELVFKHFLVEDRGLDSSPSYVDFLCHMHKEIRSLLS